MQNKTAVVSMQKISTQENTENLLIKLKMAQ